MPKEKKLVVKEIPVPFGNRHDDPKHADILPKHEFTIGIIVFPTKYRLQKVQVRRRY